MATKNTSTLTGTKLGSTGIRNNETGEETTFVERIIFEFDESPVSSCRTVDVKREHAATEALS